MDAAGLSFSSREFLRLIENLGLTGSWGWVFRTNEHVWSTGLFRLLGLDPLEARPSYDTLMALVHPEDRRLIESVAQITQHGVLRDHVFRIIRPDGSLRILSARNEVYLTPDGRPFKAAGIVMDVTDREVLTRLQANERQRRWSVFEQTRSFTFSTSLSYEFDFPQELYTLTGLREEEVQFDPYRTIVAEEREHWRALSLEALGAGRLHSSTPLAPLMEGGTGRFSVVTVPVFAPDGTIREWSSVTAPVEPVRGVVAVDGVREGLEQAVNGRHLHAARALLDWSMNDLAAASGLSLSTIRRLEEGGETASGRARHTAIQALRKAGIRFTVQGDAQIAVSLR